MQLSDNNLASELVENRSFLKPIAIEEIVIFMINAKSNLPVSLLPAASKVCERIALNQLTSYMNKNKCLTEHRSGNKAMHHCETLNVFMTDKALEAMVQGS